jgi:hypothetical protein
MRQLAEDLLATRSGLDESEALEALRTIEEAIAPDSRVRGEELRFRLAQRLGIAPARALEVAQIGCHAIASFLARDERERLLARLPADVRELFAPPATVSAPAGHAPGLTGARRTLAEGTPGSTHPLATSRPGSTHPLSDSQPPSRRVR